MPKQDPVPLPYGSLQYFQAHYIIESRSKQNDSFLARCEPLTKGHFSNKRVINVKWIGFSEFTTILQKDSKLNDMLKEVLLHEGEIKIDPLEDSIRIYGKWVHEDCFRFNPTMLEIVDRIANHIKSSLRDMGEAP